MVCVAYGIISWRLFCIIGLFLPTLLLNIGFFFIYESPKYVHEKDN